MLRKTSTLVHGAQQAIIVGQQSFIGQKWRRPCQPHPGTQCHRYGCSLPGLTGFTVDCCEGTNRATIENRPELNVAAILRRLDIFASNDATCHTATQDLRSEEHTSELQS